MTNDDRTKIDLAIAHLCNLLQGLETQRAVVKAAINAIYVAGGEEACYDIPEARASARSAAIAECRAIVARHVKEKTFYLEDGMVNRKLNDILTEFDSLLEKEQQ